MDAYLRPSEFAILGSNMLAKRKDRIGGWYIKKPFAHFDLPLNYDAALSKVSDPNFIAERAFWPLIGFIDSKRRFRKEAGVAVVSTKDRPLRYCSHRPICSSETYRKVVRGDSGLHTCLVKRNANAFGIPQGSPLSAVFSNVYMATFDLACASYFTSVGAFYRRYSDDIIIICDAEASAAALDFIKTELGKLGPSMSINDSKTEVSRFTRLAPGVFDCDAPVTYLGLTFDGRRALLRSRTISRYYRRMTYASRQTLRSAKKSSSGKVYLRSVYRDLTHLGSQNFYTYAKKASKILDDKSAVRQLRRHFRVLKRKLDNGGR